MQDFIVFQTILPHSHAQLMQCCPVGLIQFCSLVSIGFLENWVVRPVYTGFFSSFRFFDRTTGPARPNYLGSWFLRR
jgi:hypothetical protein